MVNIAQVIKRGLSMYSNELVVILQKEEKKKNNIQNFMV